MSGVLVFNNKVHPVDEVGIKIDSRIIESPNKEPLTRIDRWTIAGALVNDGSPEGLNGAMRDLELAYADGAQNYGEVSYTANGNTHTLSDTASFSGVRVVSFGYMTGPWKMHTEMSNRRAFYAVIQAEYRLSAKVIKYQEQVLRIGNGGPRWRYMPSLTGAPEYQTLSAATTIKYVQRGMLVLLDELPEANEPVFPLVNMHGERARITYHAPKSITKNGDSQTEDMHSVEWHYEGESAIFLSLSSFEVPEL